MTYLSIADRKAILRDILRGKAEDAFEKHKVPALERALFLAEADKLVTRVANRTSNVRGYYRMQRRMPLRWGYMLAGIAATAPLVGALFILCHYDLSNPINYPLASAAATLLGVFAAASGWGVASWTAHRNARAQHTINYLAQRFSNSSFSDQTAVFNRYFKGKIVDKKLIDKIAESDEEADIDALQAMRYILNWFEFIAVGVSLGDLDLRIVSKTVRSNLILYTDKCLPYIIEVRKTQPKVLENLVDLRAHFREH